MSFIDSLRKKYTNNPSYNGDPKIRGSMDKVIDSWVKSSPTKTDQNKDLTDLLLAATNNSGLSKKSQSDIKSSNSAAISAAMLGASASATMAGTNTAASAVLGQAGYGGHSGMFTGSAAMNNPSKPSIRTVRWVDENQESNTVGDMVLDESDSVVKMFNGTKWISVMAESDAKVNDDLIWVHWDTVRETLGAEPVTWKRVDMLDNTKSDIFRRFDEGLLEIEAVEDELITLTEVCGEFDIPVELANLMVVVESIASNKTMRTL